jgi:hypothetical protein
MEKIRFYDFRIDALKKWLAITNRDFDLKYSNICNDDINDSFECSWQNLYEQKHVHVFCGIGDWANNITDILLDTRYDYLYLTNNNQKNNEEYEEESKMLFRYHTRLLLVVSEMITDFEDILAEFLEKNINNKIDKIEIRKILSNGNFKEKPIKSIFSEEKNEGNHIEYNAVNVLMEYINSVCKHKFGKIDQSKIHRVNNHLPYEFQLNINIEDIYNFNNKLKLGSPTDFTYILVPNIELVTEILLNCYDVLDNQFKCEDNKDKFLNFCKNNSK